MNLYSESKGTSDRRGYVRRVSSASMPSLAASTTSAASVGSPITEPSSPTIASLSSASPRPSLVKSGTGTPATAVIAPVLRYPSPSTPNHAPFAYRVDTIIWFSVRVPVLSVLMALVAPSVSTSVRFFTTAFASASCLAPSDSRPETNAGMPVGIAEMAIAVPSSSSSFAGVPRIVPTITITATAPHAMVPRTLVSESSSFCSGDRVRVTELSIVAI